MLVGATLALALVAPAAAFAEGTEFAGAGTRGLGRGGAMVASSNDPMALHYNPAALALVPGMQLSLQTSVALYSSCLDRSGTYGAYASTLNQDQTLGSSNPEPRIPNYVEGDTAFGDPEDFYDTPMPEVCNSGIPQVLPPLVFTMRVNERFGFGIGLLVPNAVGASAFGEDSTVNGRTYRGTAGGLPAPTRYGLIEQNSLIFYPTIGFGVAVTDWLRLGASFGWGIADIRLENIVRPVRGEDWGDDIYSDLQVSDHFVPRINLSAHATPTRGLDLAFAFLWQDDIHASGTQTFESGYYRAESIDSITIDGVELEVPQSWTASLGVRYGLPRAGATDAGDVEVRDSMWTEVFDVELDLIWAMNRRVDAHTVRYPENPDDADGFYHLGIGGGLAPPIPKIIALEHYWKDQLAVRLGADWNILPGRFAMRLGLSYETSALSTTTVDFADGTSMNRRNDSLLFYPQQRVGVHIGGTVRFGRFDLALAYAHIHQLAEDVSDADASGRQSSAGYFLQENICRQTEGCDPTNPNAVEDVGSGAPSDERGTIVNAGSYSSYFDVFSLGLTYHFR